MGNLGRREEALPRGWEPRWDAKGGRGLPVQVGAGSEAQGYPFLRPVILQPHSRPRVLTLTSGPAPIFPPLLAGERAQPGGKVRLRPRGAGSPVRDSDARAPQSRDSHDDCVTLGEEWARTLPQRGASQSHVTRHSAAPPQCSSPLPSPSPCDGGCSARSLELSASPLSPTLRQSAHPPPRPLRGASEVTR